MPDDSIPGPTPTGYQRTQGGGVKWVPPSAEHLSKLLPQYEIESILGYGGMGAVYKGKQKSLHRAVAIKILPPGLEDEDASYVDRFKNEARIMAKLDHPAIVPVYDFGETSEGQLYIVMSFVDGTDVQKMLSAQGRLPPEHALAITAHVCDALKYAHEHGVIHRDIKPANILINMEGAVKVADFGLAKAEEHGSSGLTKTGMAMGTPDYVAPEALVMGTEVDGRADLYAVGVMLYAMLTGNVPRGAFKPASVMIPGIDPRFDGIVQKAMQMDREERYQSAKEIRRDLDVILTTPLVQAGGQSSAAIPKAAVAQKPVAKGPQKPMGKSANVPVRKGSASAPAPNPQSEIPNPKSKAPLFIGIGAVAAIAVGAFVMMGGEGRRPALRDQNAESAATSSGTLASSPTGSSAPIKVREEPKPTPSTAAPISNPKSTISNSPAQQFPPGKWVKVFTKFEDLPEGLRKPSSGLKFEDGWLSASPPISLRLSPDTGWTNSAVRYRTRVANSLVAVPQVRRNRAGIVAYQFNVSVRALHIKYFDSSLGQAEKREQSLSSYPWSEGSMGEGGEHVIEFGSFNQRLVGRTDSMFATHGRDARLASGDTAIYLQAPIRDIEVINLDGLPEAEALKILGVDEKGNDLRQPAAVAATSPAPAASSSPNPPAPKSAAPSSSPSLPISKSFDPKFPPGQWVKVLTKFEDLPEQLRTKGVKIEDGWIRPGDVDIATKLCEGPFLNVGIRARVHFVPDSKAYAFMSVRSSSEGRLNLARDRAGNIQRLSWIKGPPPTPSLAAFELKGTASSGEHVVELAAIADRAICRFDDQLFQTKLLSGLRPGGCSLGGTEDIRDIEVINLDGIPEAEALRILGVDEKGNDLRPAIAKQEQQKAEQAKVVDAMATIPELKKLHEQFVKLQAERATTPFEADVAKLNAGYLGGLDREIEKEKKAGHLDGVLVLEAEKKLIVTGGSAPASGAEGAQPPITAMPIPAEDDDATPANLKGLRKIYRDAFAKLEATRAANLKALTDPLTLRLKQLESTLTQQNRIDHAKTVREYRENLGKEGSTDGSAGTPARTSSNGGAAATTNEADKSVRAPLNAKDGFTNSLGMKFLPVKGTEVMFCIHEVRYKDYAAYAAESSGVAPDWKNQTHDGYALTERADEHPVVNVSWEDAQKFCAWLSKKEGKTYRLPTDQEWSVAVGLGRDEKWKKDTSPASVDKNQTEFPWGGQWPPPKGSGNYSDASRKAKALAGEAQYLGGYDDGFPTTAPVMSYKPNKFGLYDMGGNECEWCEDWYDTAQKDRVVRGSCWGYHLRDTLLSSARIHRTPGYRSGSIGFRCVLVVSGG